MEPPPGLLSIFFDRLRGRGTELRLCIVHTDARAARLHLVSDARWRRLNSRVGDVRIRDSLRDALYDSFSRYHLRDISIDWFVLLLSTL